MHRIVIQMLLLASFCLTTALAADKIDGKWSASYDTQAGPITTTWDLKSEGTKLTGKATSSFGDRDITEGKIEGSQISWVEVISSQGVTVRVVCKGILSGDELKISRIVGDVGTNEVVAKRVK